MTAQENLIWGIHAGKLGEADTLFLKSNYIAIGWSEMGDLGKIKAEREAFKDKVAECYPNEKPRGVPNLAGKLFRFVYEMKRGDLVIYPSKQGRQIHFGQVEGSYKYDPGLDKGYPNLRPVRWLRSFPRTNFSQGALYEIGSAMTFFQVKNYSDEFRLALEGELKVDAVGKDETIEEVSQAIEDSARDFVLKRLSQELKGHPLAQFTAHLLETMGYRTRLSPEGPDRGVDVIAHKDELGFGPPIIKVQVKSSSGTIGDPEVSSLYGKVGSKEFGLMVILSSFTSQARNFAETKSNLRLIDGNELVDLILQHYESLDSVYKGLIPLKRVYVPEQVEE